MWQLKGSMRNFKKKFDFQEFEFFSIEVQQNGLNFIYDMQNCSASQFDINLSKKILKLLQVICLSFDKIIFNFYLGWLSSYVKKYIYCISSQMVQSSL
jgi:hypothetical protein